MEIIFRNHVYNTESEEEMIHLQHALDTWDIHLRTQEKKQQKAALLNASSNRRSTT